MKRKKRKTSKEKKKFLWNKSDERWQTGSQVDYHRARLMWIIVSAATLFIIKCAVLAVTQGQVFQNDQQRWVVPHRIHNAMCSGMMDGMIFHDPDSCDAYVQCQRGTVTRMKCPQGMLFDLSLLYCVAARSVNCGTRGHAGMVAPTMPNYPERPPSQESHHSVRRYFLDIQNRKNMKSVFLGLS